MKSLSLLKLVGSIFESGIMWTSQILNMSSYDSWWQIITICRKIRLFEKWLFGIHIVVTSLEIWRLLVILVIDKIYGWSSCLCPLNYIIELNKLFTKLCLSLGKKLTKYCKAPHPTSYHLVSAGTTTQSCSKFSCRGVCLLRSTCLRNYFRWHYKR